MPPTIAFDESKMSQGAASAPSQALPACVVQRADGVWHLQGHGRFSWSVFRIYNAGLWVRQSFSWHDPFILDLAYLRNVSTSQIVDASIQEMRRLRQIETLKLTQWRDELYGFVPNVGLGDRLLGLFEPSVGVTFFSQDAMLGEIRDAVFVDAFAAVWLDPSTKAPQLRMALLGDSGI
jgi:hypothetical protein